MKPLQTRLIFDRLAWDVQNAIAFLLIGRDGGVSAAGVWAVGLFLARFPTSLFHSNYLHPFWMGARVGERSPPLSEAASFLLFYGAAGAITGWLNCSALAVAFLYSAETLWHDCLVVSDEAEAEGGSLIGASCVSFGSFLTLYLTLPSVSGLIRTGCALGLSRVAADVYLALRAKSRGACFRPRWPSQWAGMRRFAAYANEVVLIQGFFLWVALRQGAGALGQIALVLSLFRPIEILVQGDARYLLGQWSALPAQSTHWVRARNQIGSRMRLVALLSLSMYFLGRPVAEALYRYSFSPKLFVLASGYVVSVAAVVYFRNLSLAFGRLPPLTWLVLLGGATNALLCEFAGGSLAQAFLGQTVILILFAVFLWSAARKPPAIAFA